MGVSAAEGFLKDLGLWAEIGDMPGFAARFEAEMLAGLSGGESSLRMLPSYISPDDVEGALRSGAGGGSVIAIDAGGTNLRVAAVSPRGGIGRSEKSLMPGVKREIGVEEFFDGIAGCLAPVISESDSIGFCFSYPAEILPNRDARIVSFTKELKVRDAEGALVGEMLRAALKARGLPCDKRIAVLNDTVATQLGALWAAGGEERRGGFMGLIMGTGINASYTEKNGSILKDAALAARPGFTIVNIEAGGYRGLPLEEADRRFMASTADPGGQWLEKMAAGAYHGGLMLEWMRFAGERGLFSDGFRRRLDGLGAIGVGEADRFCLSQDGENALSGLCAGEDDRERLRLLIEAFFDRVSFIVASTLAATLARMGDVARDPARPVRISAEGSTFYGSRMLRPRIDRCMSVGARGMMGLCHRFVRVENVTLMGAALAGLV
ncbi:MAG: hexokinase [Clostridiales Family XIII bacterium]|jgi:hexokinase|nr:hexokinase [Clostridiales Family XIII bacterium]